MATILATARNDVSSRLAVAHASGGTSFTVRDGEGVRFGSPTPSAPIRFTVARRSTLVSNQVVYTTTKSIFFCTDVTGDVLSGLTLKEGTSDHDYAVNDPVAILYTEGTVNDLNALALANEAGLLLKADATATTTALALKANDSAVVKLAGTQTITGVKTARIASAGFTLVSRFELSANGSITEMSAIGLGAATAAEGSFVKSAVGHRRTAGNGGGQMEFYVTASSAASNVAASDMRVIVHDTGLAVSTSTTVPAGGWRPFTVRGSTLYIGGNFQQIWKDEAGVNGAFTKAVAFGMSPTGGSPDDDFHISTHDGSAAGWIERVRVSSSNGSMALFSSLVLPAVADAAIPNGGIAWSLGTPNALKARTPAGVLKTVAFVEDL